MAKYIWRRVLYLLFTVFVASIGVWYMIYLLPGNPADAILGINATPEQYAHERQVLGLNTPLIHQYLAWLERIIHGNLGVSAINGFPVTSLLAARLPASLQLVVASFVFALIVGVPIAIAAARRPRSAIGWATSGYASVALAMPQFWLGLLLILVFSVELGWLPPSSPYVPIWHNPVEALRDLILPVITLGSYLAGIVIRFLRGAIEEELQTQYVVTARSKGAGPGRVVYLHALRNAALPTVTMIAFQFGPLIGGTVVTESVFQYPGLGSLVLSSVLNRDYVVLQALVLLLVIAVALANLAGDVVHSLLDPRIRIS